MTGRIVTSIETILINEIYYCITKDEGYDLK